MATAFQSQLTSLVAEGVFDRFPALRIALIESGFAWLPAFLWRFDKGWRGLRREVPWTHAAAVGVRARARAGRAAAGRRPRARPRSSAACSTSSAPRTMLMFASDYPHRHSDEGLEAVPAALDRAADAARVLLRQRP